MPDAASVALKNRSGQMDGQPVGEAATGVVDGRVVGRLAGELAALVGAGEIDAARDLHRQIGALLRELPEQGACTAHDTSGRLEAGSPSHASADVLNLEAERKRRAGR